MARLCHAAGVTRGVLRLDEREGRRALAPRTRAASRCYSPDDVRRLPDIRQLREVGCALHGIGLQLDEHRAGEPDPTRLCTLARVELGVIEARIARLSVVHDDLAPLAHGGTELLAESECRVLLDLLAAGAAARSRTPPAAQSVSPVRRPPQTGAARRMAR